MIGRRKRREAVLVPEADRTRSPGGSQGTGERAVPAVVEAQQTVTRFGHGSRVPGWDDACDLEKDPAEVPDPATTAVPAALRAEIEAHMAKYPDFHSAAIPALAAAQRLHGWCSPEAIEQAACVMRLTPGYLISVASFYDMLETHPVGRNRIYVCTNISCSLCGADELMQRMLDETAGDPDFNVRSFECLGACDIAPMASVNDVYVGPLAPDDVAPLIEQVRAGVPPLPGKQLHLRKSTDPGGTASVAPPKPMPDQPPTSVGPEMGGAATGPPAAIERPPLEES
jgi:NADH:ubiquinone oxidoreductase subunit E